MGTASPAEQASIENDPAAKQERPGYRCHTFSSSDERTAVVAFLGSQTMGSECAGGTCGDNLAADPRTPPCLPVRSADWEPDRNLREMVGSRVQRSSYDVSK